MNEQVRPAAVEFRDGRLWSTKFGDFYYQQGGRAEPEQVFLGPAAISDRLARAELFTVSEFGFGTGMNFAATVATFLESSTARGRLRYLAFENQPLHVADLQRAMSSWQDLHHIRSEFEFAFPPPVAGWHSRHFLGGRVHLAVFVGDVATGLRQVVSQDQLGVDAWFLDGFAPRLNPDMWESELFSLLSRLTLPNGTVTSFSVAGHVRRHLAEAGFQAKRIPAPGPKRHTLLARVAESKFRTKTRPRSVTVAGSGLAGATVARALSERNVEVRLLAPRVSNQSEASQIPAAIMHARMSNTRTAQGLFRIHSYCFATVRAAGLAGSTQVGTIHCPGKSFPKSRLEQVREALGRPWADALDLEEISKQTGIRINEGAVWFSRSRWVHGQSLRQALCDDELITVEKRRLHASDAVEGVVVVATGPALPACVALPPIELTGIWGQIDEFALHAELDHPLIILADGYLALKSGTAFAGSTYEQTPWPPGEATIANRRRLSSLSRHLIGNRVSTFRALRAVTSDRLPVVGKAGDGIWASLGHGSNGTTSTFYAAELIAAEICGELIPAMSPVLSLLSPMRFAKRQLRRPDPFRP